MSDLKGIEERAYQSAMRHTPRDRYVYAFAYLSAGVRAKTITPAMLRAEARGLDRAIADKS
jgi:hypothetical protein